MMPMLSRSGLVLHGLMERIGEMESLERLAEPSAQWIRKVTDPRPIKNLLSGTWLGHRLHPLLTDVVIGSMSSVTLLDLVGGERSEPAADLLLATGLAASVPTSLAGLSDWTDVYDRGRRVGVVHAMLNTVSSGLSTASLIARRRGNRRAGVALALTGFGVMAASSYVGGHMSFVQGIGVDHTGFDEGPKEWTRVLPDAELSEGTPHVVTPGENEVLLYRSNGQLIAMANRCTHAGQPIAEGPIENGCITCPHHGSIFRLADGEVIRAPAATPQPMYEVRVHNGFVEVRGR